MSTDSQVPRSAGGPEGVEFAKMLDDLENFSIYGCGSLYDNIKPANGFSEPISVAPIAQVGDLLNVASGADSYNMPYGDYTFIDRVKILRQSPSFGFTPMTKDEASMALQTTGKDGDVDSARYLNEILLHQNNAGFDGQRALRAVANQIIAFHTDASLLRLALLSNYQTLREIDNPKISIEDLQAQEVLVDSGILSVTRRAEIDEMIKSGDSERKLRKIHRHGISSAGIVGIPLLTVELETLGIDPTIKSLREATLTSGKEQAKRRAFWLKVLQDGANRHLAAKPLVEAYLVRVLNEQTVV